MSLFCLRKSLETEEHSNISTHHQRAHIHNTKHDMSKGEKKAMAMTIKPTSGLAVMLEFGLLKKV